MIKIKGINFAIVEIVCIDPLVLDPKVFINAINAITPIVIGSTKFSFPSNIALCLPNITDMAAIVAGKNNTDCIQPVKKPSLLS